MPEGENLDTEDYEDPELERGTEAHAVLESAKVLNLFFSYFSSVPIFPQHLQPGILLQNDLLYRYGLVLSEKYGGQILHRSLHSSSFERIRYCISTREYENTRWQLSEKRASWLTY